MSEYIQFFEQEVALDATYLHIDFFRDKGIDELQKLTALKLLEHLNAASADLNDDHLEIIGQLVSLELLDLDLTELSDQSLRFIEPLQNLRELRLKDNPQLTDECIPSLIQLTSLKQVHIENTGITWKGLKQLVSEVDLESVILGSEFNDFEDELLTISSLRPEMEILFKGMGMIRNGNWL